MEACVKIIVTTNEFEPGPSAQVSSVITTTPLRIIYVDHLKKVSAEFVCLFPDMPGFKSP